MTAAEFEEIWKQLNAAQCEIIAGRRANTKHLTEYRLKKAVRVVRKAEKMMLKLLPNGNLKS